MVREGAVTDHSILITSGLAYRHIPAVSGSLTEGDVEAVRAALDELEGPVLAFCRSGTRSALALGLAKREQGASADEVHRCLTEAGFDPGPIAHLL